MSNYNLNIFTPGGVVVEKLQCSELTVPTNMGLINVLKGHTHIITEVDTGTLIAKLENGQARHFTMAGGLCKILGDTVTILAKTSEAPESIDVERAQSALHKAQSRLKDGVPGIAQIKFQRKVERAKARIAAANLK
jgi:F-type H+-transporting ATPase subunit epsilon